MRYPTLAAALLFAAAAPAATAMTIDADERELYDNSIRCMAFFGILAGFGSDGAEDPKMVESGTKFLAVATVLADEDKDQIGQDFSAEMVRFQKISENPDNPANLQRLNDIDEKCKFLETVVDKMLEG